MKVHKKISLKLRELREVALHPIVVGDNQVHQSISCDIFEFLEAPLVQAGQKELMEKVETSIRIELRDMIRNGAPSSQVNQKIDSILEDMGIVSVAVPEFGTIAMMILAVAIVSIVVVTSKTKTIANFNNF